MALFQEVEADTPTIQMIVEWLDHLLDKHDPVVVFTHHFTTLVPEWVEQKYDRTHTSGTFERKWRRLRSDERHRLSQAGIAVLELPSDLHPKSNEKAWQIQRTTPGSKSQSTNPASEPPASN